MNQYKTALIGCGRIGSYTRPELKTRLPVGWLPLSHADAIAVVPELNLCALADSDAEALESAQKRLGVDSLYENPFELLEKEQPVVLSIATRTQGRCDLIKAAIKNGVKAIHAEKPLARTLAETRETLAMLGDNNVYFTYGTTRRYMPIFQKAKEMVDEGMIGKLRQIQIAFGAGPLFWLHPHSIDLMLFFSNNANVETVQADCDIPKNLVSGRLIDCDPNVHHARVEFSTGVEGLISQEPGMNCRLVGEEGTLEVLGDGSRLRLATAADGSPLRLKESVIDIHATESGTENAFRSLVAALENGIEPPICLDEVESNQAILFTIVASSLEGGKKLDFNMTSNDFEISGRTGQLFA